MNSHEDDLISSLFEGHDELLEDVVGDFETRRRPLSETEITQPTFTNPEDGQVFLPIMTNCRARWSRIRPQVLNSLSGLSHTIVGDEAMQVLKRFDFRPMEAFENPKACPACGSTSTKLSGGAPSRNIPPVRKCESCGNVFEIVPKPRSESLSSSAKVTNLHAHSPVLPQHEARMITRKNYPQHLDPLHPTDHARKHFEARGISESSSDFFGNLTTRKPSSWEDIPSIHFDDIARKHQDHLLSLPHFEVPHTHHPMGVKLPDHLKHQGTGEMQNVSIFGPGGGIRNTSFEKKTGPSEVMFKHDNHHYYVRTEGYDYPRYVLRVDGHPGAGGSDDDFMKAMRIKMPEHFESSILLSGRFRRTDGSVSELYIPSVDALIDAHVDEVDNRSRTDKIRDMMNHPNTEPHLRDVAQRMYAKHGGQSVPPKSTPPRSAPRSTSSSGYEYQPFEGVANGRAHVVNGLRVSPVATRGNEYAAAAGMFRRAGVRISHFPGHGQGRFPGWQSISLHADKIRAHSQYPNERADVHASTGLGGNPYAGGSGTAIPFMVSHSWEEHKYPNIPAEEFNKKYHARVSEPYDHYTSFNHPQELLDHMYGPFEAHQMSDEDEARLGVSEDELAHPDSIDQGGDQAPFSAVESTVHTAPKEFGYKYYGPHANGGSWYRSGMHEIVVDGGRWHHQGPGGVRGTGNGVDSMVSHLSRVHPGTVRESLVLAVCEARVREGRCAGCGAKGCGRSGLCAACTESVDEARGNWTFGQIAKKHGFKQVGRGDYQRGDAELSHDRKTATTYMPGDGVKYHESPEVLHDYLSMHAMGRLPSQRDSYGVIGKEGYEELQRKFGTGKKESTDPVESMLNEFQQTGHVVISEHGCDMSSYYRFDFKPGDKVLYANRVHKYVAPEQNGKHTLRTHDGYTVSAHEDDIRPYSGENIYGYSESLAEAIYHNHSDALEMNGWKKGSEPGSWEGPEGHKITVGADGNWVHEKHGHDLEHYVHVDAQSINPKHKYHGSEADNSRKALYPYLHSVGYGHLANPHDVSSVGYDDVTVRLDKKRDAQDLVRKLNPILPPPTSTWSIDSGGQNAHHVAMGWDEHETNRDPWTADTYYGDAGDDDTIHHIASGSNQDSLESHLHNFGLHFKSHHNQMPESRVNEKAPPGFEGTVRAMKGYSDIDNPYALAWYMKNKGYKSHRKQDGSPKNEASSDYPRSSGGRIAGVAKDFGYDFDDSQSGSGFVSMRHGAGHEITFDDTGRWTYHPPRGVSSYQGATGNGHNDLASHLQKIHGFRYSESRDFPVHSEGHQCVGCGSHHDVDYETGFCLKCIAPVMRDAHQEGLHTSPKGNFDERCPECWAEQEKRHRTHEHIVRHGSGYRLLSHSGKNLGTYPTRGGAEKREREVEYFKHKGESVSELHVDPLIRHLDKDARVFDFDPDREHHNDHSVSSIMSHYGWTRDGDIWSHPNHPVSQSHQELMSMNPEDLDRAMFRIHSGGSRYYGEGDNWDRYLDRLSEYKTPMQMPKKPEDIEAMHDREAQQLGLSKIPKPQSTSMPRTFSLDPAATESVSKGYIVPMPPSTNGQIPDGTHAGYAVQNPEAAMSLQNLHRRLGFALPELHALVTSTVTDERTALSMLFNELNTAHCDIGNVIAYQNAVPPLQMAELRDHYEMVISQMLAALDPYKGSNPAVVGMGPYKLGGQLNDSRRGINRATGHRYEGPIPDLSGILDESRDMPGHGRCPNCKRMAVSVGRATGDCKNCGAKNVTPIGPPTPEEEAARAASQLSVDSGFSVTDLASEFGFKHAGKHDGRDRYQRASTKHTIDYDKETHDWDLIKAKPGLGQFTFDKKSGVGLDALNHHLEMEGAPRESDPIEALITENLSETFVGDRGPRLDALRRLSSMDTPEGRLAKDRLGDHLRTYQPLPHTPSTPSHEEYYTPNPVGPRSYDEPFGPSKLLGTRVKLNMPGHPYHGDSGRVSRQQGNGLAVEFDRRPGKVEFFTHRDLERI